MHTLARCPSICHRISAANLRKRKLGLLCRGICFQFSPRAYSARRVPQTWAEVGAARHCGAARPKGADSPASEAGPAASLARGATLCPALGRCVCIQENREPFPAGCPRSGFIRIQTVQTAAREILSILKMTRLNLLDQDSCVVQEMKIVQIALCPV